MKCKYTDKEDKWLLDHADECTYKELSHRFNREFHRKYSEGSIRSHLINTLDYRKGIYYYHTDESDEWLKQNLHLYTYPELTARFNELFHTSASVSSITTRCIRILKLHRNVQHIYTAEEDKWLRENVDAGTYEELAVMFNERFSLNVTYDSLTSHILKSLKLNKEINRGDFKKGERNCTNTLPVGSESFNGQYLYVKIADSVNDCKGTRMPSKSQDPNWMRKDYIVWQEAGRELPSDSRQMLIHLNTDKQDCRLENLYLTTRKINFMMAKNGWYSTNPDITLAGLKWCELFYARKEKL